MFKFQYDIVKGLIPRVFEENSLMHDEMIIYDEDQEIGEMYLITEGSVGICFSIMKAGFNGSNIMISKR